MLIILQVDKYQWDGKYGDRVSWWSFKKQNLFGDDAAEFSLQLFM